MLNRIPILIPTYHKMEQFLTPALELLEHTWPSHGDIFIISDNKSTESTLNQKFRVYRFPSNFTWIQILDEGLKSLRKEFPSIQHVYLILDDLLPLLPVDQKRLEAIENSFLTNEWKYIYFPHYENDYSFDISTNNERFSRTSKNYKYYSQIGAGLISVDHLIELCEIALTMNFGSPWQFEYIKHEADHFVTELRWTSVRDGFSKSKFINKKAIQALNYKEGESLKHVLKKAYRDETLLRITSFLIQKYKNILFRIKGLKRRFDS